MHLCCNPKSRTSESSNLISSPVSFDDADNGRTVAFADTLRCDCSGVCTMCTGTDWDVLDGD